MKGGKKRYKAICYSCDRAFVAGGKKCKICGRRMPDKKIIRPNHFVDVNDMVIILPASVR